MQAVPAPPAPPELPVVMQTGGVPWMPPLDPAALVVIVMAALTVTAILLWPVVRSLARRIEGSGSQALREEMASLHERMAELEAGQVRLTELEERIDFNERMLVRETRRGADASG